MTIKSSTYRLLRLLSLGLFMFIVCCYFNTLSAQMPAKLVQQTQYDTEAIMKQFTFGENQRSKVYSIVKKKNNDILSIEMLQKENPDQYHLKMKNLHDGMMNSLVLIMNEDQKEIYQQLKVQQRIKNRENKQSLNKNQKKD